MRTSKRKREWKAPRGKQVGRGGRADDLWRQVCGTNEKMGRYRAWWHQEVGRKTKEVGRKCRWVSGG
jgi:hypothetical protein